MSIPAPTVLPGSAQMRDQVSSVKCADTNPTQLTLSCWIYSWQARWPFTSSTSPMFPPVPASNRERERKRERERDEREQREQCCCPTRWADTAVPYDPGTAVLHTGRTPSRNMEQLFRAECCRTADTRRGEGELVAPEHRVHPSSTPTVTGGARLDAPVDTVIINNQH